MTDIVVNPGRPEPPIVVESAGTDQITVGANRDTGAPIVTALSAPDEIAVEIGRGPQGPVGPEGPAGPGTNLTWTAATSTVASDTGTDAVLTVADGSNPGLMTSANFTKLAGVATGATANSPDATLLARANHTGTQPAATISDFSTAVAATAAVTANTAKVTNATHTGDATGSGALTLATVNANVGSFGSATQVATFTANAKGLTTAAGNTAIAIPATQVTDFSEAVDDRVAALAVAGANMTITYNDAANTLTFAASGGGGGFTDTFETVSKNLSASDATITYAGGNIDEIAYANGINKNFTYGVDGLETIVLSGATPGGIDLTKTLQYTLGEFTGFAYS